MNLLLFGPPGAGKGTQSALLVERKRFIHFSTGNMLREAIREGSELGKKAKSIMDKGSLVPDSIVISLVEDELKKLKGKNFILDGFPRTVTQAEALDELMSKLGLSLDRAFFLSVPQDLIVRRLTGRRMTKDGRHVYHIEFSPPKKMGVCDVTSEELIQRPDDREEVVSSRLEAYEASTAPLKKYYEKSGILVEVNGVGSSEEVYSKIVSSMNF